jgi:hypothetical protein
MRFNRRMTDGVSDGALYRFALGHRTSSALRAASWER